MSPSPTLRFPSLQHASKGTVRGQDGIETRAVLAPLHTYETPVHGVVRIASDFGDSPPPILDMRQNATFAVGALTYVSKQSSPCGPSLS